MRAAARVSITVLSRAIRLDMVLQFTVVGTVMGYAPIALWIGIAGAALVVGVVGYILLRRRKKQ